ncbi:NAD(P)/FAD-dependent oxidoreductase [Flectobacillus roseus]|uniref:NAD(P)/FAD-dependent oxidoreductase n=1 Tax=Flectobacillus roseus TaxID=502259 RepID=A0ABT6Y3A6_9BACT|nr:NAD(P)/FAD-dependent oxidoreductase [Flectobacillus roseus]MDI9858040.1 NAD(P)/FAD-dependent oxidoreductase [Flectobacillus roseus]
METNNTEIYPIAIVGGGLAGLCAAIHLQKSGKQVILFEKKHYPFHRVCGEYISNETKNYLTKIGLNLEKLDIQKISKFQFTAPSGRSLHYPLDLGGFGLSRYTLDNELYKIALKCGVHCQTGTEVESIHFEENQFKIQLSHSNQIIYANYVLGAYGKRTKLDQYLQRPFLQARSPYIGVKYHIRYDYPKDLISLHNFENGYCGISAIEDNKYCLCYLTTRENLRKYKSVSEMERNILWKNPHLKQIFLEAEFLYDKPEVINEISFSPKKQIENHIIMIGDTAGLITPLCGNGMAMAIHGAKLISEIILENFDNREAVEVQYQNAWKNYFGFRLWAGRHIQSLFGHPVLTEFVRYFFKICRPALGIFIQSTHGKEF